MNPAIDQPTASSSSGLSLSSRTVERPTDAGFTVVSGLDGARRAKVDAGGLVTPFGEAWSLDWWIGGDDRWYVPAREPAIRQRRIGHGPVIETSLRVPSGDVVHTVHPVLVAGKSVAIVEIRNDSPVPVALAVAIRPYTVDGSPSSPLRLELHGSAVVVNGQPGVLLPRHPNEAGASADVDIVEAVEAGESLSWEGVISGGVANAICLYPLPHKTSLRFVLPGQDGPTVGAIDDLTDADVAARGWTAVVEKAARFEFPDPGVTALSGAARARLLLEAEGLPQRVVDVEPAAGLLLEALAAGGHRVECGWALNALALSFAGRLGGEPADAAEVVVGAAAAAELVADDDLIERLLEPVAQLTHLVERSKDGAATAAARSGLARFAALTNQPDVVRELSAGSENGGLIDAVPDAQAALDALEALSAEAAPAGRWGTTDDVEPAARYWLAANRLLVRPGVQPAEGATVVELLPVFPTAWRGGAVEVFRAPVAGVRVSFAIRWHGYRPALLWDIEFEGSEPHRGLLITCPGLDPEWRTTETKGEALLAGAAEELPDAPAPGDSFI